MRPTFVLSFDEELLWGRVGRSVVDLETSRDVVRRLLALLHDYRISATWAIVGHLFLRSCERGSDGRPHPAMARPRYDWYGGDWLRDDPCSDRTIDPLWYGDDLVDAIASAATPQEIASHSFSHLLFNDRGCSPEAVADDLAACVSAAEQRGLTLRSFVFPHNGEGHHTALRAHGFTAYRGADPTWFSSLPAGTHRIGHLVDQVAALAPPVSVPTETLPGLWNIPGSMVLLSRRGPRRIVPVSARIAKARAGLDRAVREGKIFHLWLHSFNVAYDQDAMLGALGAILAEVARRRDRGELDARTMGEVAASCVSG